MTLKRFVQQVSFKRLMRSIARDLLPYAGLEVQTPAGLHLCVPDRGAWSSLGEVFIARGYDPFYQQLDGVRHWVDLGCNQGFFSFGLLDHLAGRNAGKPPETRVFLGDAGDACVARASAAIERNGLQSRWKCERVVIGPPGETVVFRQHKDSLHSNIFGRGHCVRTFNCPTTDITELLARQTDLFDLVKIDIEGAEKFLFDNHLGFLKRFRYGLCEWHAPVFPGTELESRLRRLNWRTVRFCSSGVDYDLRRGNAWESLMGTVLWENPAPAH